MAKILALDIGDQWTGSAISDSSKIFAKPYKTVKTEELEIFLEELFKLEALDDIILGYPKTMAGRESDQTRKVLLIKEELEKRFSSINFILWDERLSSKRAENIKQAKTKEDKIKSHSLAAAFILDSYLSYLAIKNSA